MFDRFATLCIGYLEHLAVLQPGSDLSAALHFFVMDVTKIFVLLVVVIYAVGSGRSPRRDPRVWRQPPPD